MKCYRHQEYLCKVCHSVNAQGYLKSVPKYVKGSEKQCTWKDYPKKSIPKHSKKFHNTKTKHSQYWKENLTQKNTIKLQPCIEIITIPTIPFTIFLKIHYKK